MSSGRVYCRNCLRESKEVKVFQSIKWCLTCGADELLCEDCHKDPKSTRIQRMCLKCYESNAKPFFGSGRGGTSARQRYGKGKTNG